MKLLRDLDNLPHPVRHGAVTIGNFDGVHVGHARIVDRLVAKARELGGPAVVLTFDPHPARVLRPEEPPAPLCWTERKAHLLGQLGVDAVIACPTDKALLQLEARQFFDRTLGDRLAARAVVEGPNFFFGRNRQGDVDLLRTLCGEAGIALEICPPVHVAGQVVSSSLIRTLLADGRVELARQMLTDPYRIRGTVVRGAGRGTELGYPTANVADFDTLLPGEGIYAGRALVDRRQWPAAISLGPNLTFDEGVRKVEAYLLDYAGDLFYDRRIEVDFLARLRDIVRFDSVAGLVAEMGRDAATAREIVMGYRDY